MSDKKENQIWGIVVCLIILFGANILFNAWISEGARVFYLDDLGCIMAVNQANNWMEFAFSLGGQKIRPVAMSIIYFVVKLSERNFEIIDEVLLTLNLFNSIMIFAFAYWMIKSKKIVVKMGISLTCGVLFLVSHFAYYNISEVFGIMEGLGVFLAIGILFSLLQYIEKGKNVYFYIATGMYAAILYTHERYFVLFILFIMAFFVRNGVRQREKYIIFLLPFLLLISFWGVRILLFGNRAVDGTGGTDIKETFNVVTVIKFCFSQVGYILGFQCGPQYLNGIEAGQVSWFINLILRLRVLIILIVTVLFIRLLFIDKEFRQMHLGKFIMFLGFIALCIGSSSITIRVEMRWIYVSYAMFLVLFAYMTHIVLRHHGINNFRIFVFILFFLLTVIAEQYYRGYYYNIYYWGTKDLSKELYNETVGRYGVELEDRDIIIISEKPIWEGWGEFEWKNFFSPYVNSENISVSYVNNTLQAQEQRTGNSIILVEDIRDKEYMDITNMLSMDEMSLMHIDKLYGIYEDWWCEPDCAFEIRGNAGEKVVLTFYYPEGMEKIGTANGIVIINEENQVEYEMIDNLMRVEIELSESEVNTIRIISNYWVHENTDRSEDGRLSCVLNVEFEE